MSRPNSRSPSPTKRASKKKNTLYVWSEWYLWHNPITVSNYVRERYLQPSPHWEHPETKRRFHNLLLVSRLFEQLKSKQIHDAHPEVLQYIRTVHTQEYIDHALSFNEKGGVIGDETVVEPFGVDIALKSTSGVLHAIDEVVSGRADNAYALVRPPGHHAEPDRAMGFCIFNNIAVGARYAQAKYPNVIKRVAIVDIDVHHGNGTQKMFYEDGSVFFLSIHQSSNYPHKSGLITDRGTGDGMYTTINVPLPPGSGEGAYRATFERVVMPTLDAYKPDIILVSCGFDASFGDPLGAMCCGSEDYRMMTKFIMQAADKHCSGRCIFVHEGGYSETVVPFCGLAVVEQLSCIRTPVEDPFLGDVLGWDYRELQTHQDRVITEAAKLVRDIK